MIHTLSNKVKQRKSKLSSFLRNNKEDLSPEKHHQMHGALNEIDYILNILENHKEKEIEKENNPEDDVFLLKPVNKKTINVFEFVKGLF